MKIRQLLPFLALNVVVTVLTTLLVLWTWELTRQVKIPGGSKAPAALYPTAMLTAPTTLPAADETVLVIDSVTGAGDAPTERVRISRVGGGDLWLTGWELRDENNNRYAFPAMNFQGGTIEVYTRVGVDTPLVLHWNREEPVWQSGEQAAIYDGAGNRQASAFTP